jgi:hypothetical protein
MRCRLVFGATCARRGSAQYELILQRRSTSRQDANRDEDLSDGDHRQADHALGKAKSVLLKNAIGLVIFAIF